MQSAFGVDHGEVSKADRSRVPDWAGGVIPASAANAYNRSTSHKGEALASNFAVKSGAAALGGLTGIGLTALAVKTKKLPKWFLKDSTIRPIKHITKNPTTIRAGEKQRSIATSIGGAIGGVAGGTAANYHLKAVRKNPRYNEGRY
jgi:hypothetical protein